MNEVIEYFEELGLNELIKGKDGTLMYKESNLSSAKEIVEGYFEGKDIDSEARKAILRCILESTWLKLKRSRNTVNLSSLQNNLSKTGLSKQEICGMMINLAVNGSILEQSGYNYSVLLSHGRQKINQTLMSEYRSDIDAELVPFTIVTPSTIAKAKSEKMSENEELELQKYFENLGLAEFIRDRKGNLIYPYKNLYMARQIVEGHFKESDDIGDDVCRNKKAVLQCVLKNKCLQIKNKNSSSYLVTLMQKMEKMGFSEKDVFGIIINLAINGRIIDAFSHSYTNFLRDLNKFEKSIKENKGEIETKVMSFTIEKAKSINMSKNERSALHKYFEDLGLSELIRDKENKEENKEDDENNRDADSNLYMARQIVEGYFEEHEFTGEDINEYKRTILRGLLEGRDGELKNIRIAELMINMEKSGLSEQEVYGIIINLVLNRINVDGHRYSVLAKGSPLVYEGMSKQLKAMKAAGVLPTEVVTSTRIYGYFENLGLSEFIRDEKGKIIYTDSNLYTARQIVEGYFEEQCISDEEKTAILRCILKCRVLKNRKMMGLWELIQNLLENGFDKSKIYGMIINLSVNGKINEHSYADLLINKDNVCQAIAQDGELETSVRKETIQKALKKKNRKDRKDRKVGAKAIAAEGLYILSQPEDSAVLDGVEQDLHCEMGKLNDGKGEVINGG